MPIRWLWGAGAAILVVTFAADAPERASSLARVSARGSPCFVFRPVALVSPVRPGPESRSSLAELHRRYLALVLDSEQQLTCHK